MHAQIAAGESKPYPFFVCLFVWFPVSQKVGQDLSCILGLCPLLLVPNGSTVRLSDSERERARERKVWWTANKRGFCPQASPFCNLRTPESSGQGPDWSERAVLLPLRTVEMKFPLTVFLRYIDSHTALYTHTYHFFFSEVTWSQTVPRKILK